MKHNYWFLLRTLLKEVIITPNKIFKSILFGLSITPVVEILLYKSIIDLSMSTNILETSGFERPFSIFILVFFALLIVSISKYYFNLKKVQLVNSMCKEKSISFKLSVISENWYRAALVELSIISISSLQILSLILVAMLINIYIGIGMFVLVMVVYHFVFILFIEETKNQLAYVHEAKRIKESNSGDKLYSRIKRAEQSRIFGFLIMSLTIVISFSLYLSGRISTEVFILYLFISKYAGNMLSMFSSSFMRLSRSLPYIEEIFPLGAVK